MTIAGRHIAWTDITPVAALVVLAVSSGHDLPVAAATVVGLVLAAAVLAAVHHAEVIAHRLGEPFGSLVLAVAVTVIEVGLILSLTAAGGASSHSLARDTVFAAVMITCNGILGLSLFIGAVRRGLAVFNAEGSGAALATVATLSTVCLVLPTFTTSQPGPAYTPAQLTFAAVASLLLYAVFVTTQTVRHRDFFLPVEHTPVEDTPDDDHLGEPVDERGDEEVDDGGQAEEHAAPPANAAALRSLALLVASLVGVVGLAKVESHTIEDAVARAGLPPSFVGVVIALLVLLPETLAAANAARRDRLQVSINLPFGSAIASIGLTIPAVAVASIWTGGPLLLGLGGTQLVLLALTVVVGALT